MTHSKISPSMRIKAAQLTWKIRFALTPFAKRFLDITVSIIALILASPLLILVAMLIRLESKGGALFQQERIGLNGMPFTMFKFRSMTVDAQSQRQELEEKNEMSSGVIFKIKRDPRITRIGALIRKRGDMSLVGPRPPLPSEVSEYSRADRLRLTVPPGITCLWQISGRSDIPFEQQVQLDIKYIERQNIWFDLLVLLKTIPAVLKARGAY